MDSKLIRSSNFSYKGFNVASAAPKPNTDIITLKAKMNVILNQRSPPRRMKDLGSILASCPFGHPDPSIAFGSLRMTTFVNTKH
jgi:hypothetical protein